MLGGCSPSGSESGAAAEGPDAFENMMRYTGGDPSKVHKWVLGEEPQLVKAGEDAVVRMNNDTYYKMVFTLLDNGPVVLGSSASSEERFSSFQLMDDRNVNYRNIIFPKGEYTLYHGEKPAQISGEAVEVPSSLSAVIVRVEVKNKNDPKDVAAAKAVFNGITVDGPAVTEMPKVDLLSGFDEKVATEAQRRMREKYTSTDLGELIARFDQEVGTDISYLNLAAGTKCCWGGPDPSHSDYELIFKDESGETLDATKGNYTLTTEEPPVDAFWSITVYDTDRGGFLHPNKHDLYHINNTAAVRNPDGTVTFNFKQSCGDSDQNCLEVPAGPFDLAARYYLPHDEVISKAWRLPKVKLAESP
jgi:hypothetical protein